MLTENGMDIDLEAVASVLRQADVLTIGFTTFAERLLVDTRFNATIGPMTATAEPVATVQERYLWLGRHRGTFGAPKAFSFFVWPMTVRSLVEGDVLAPMRERLAAVSDSAAADFDRKLQEFLAFEREALRGAVRGDERWQTLWERANA